MSGLKSFVIHRYVYYFTFSESYSASLGCYLDPIGTILFNRVARPNTPDVLGLAVYSLSDTELGTKRASACVVVILRVAIPKDESCHPGETPGFQLKTLVPNDLPCEGSVSERLGENKPLIVSMWVSLRHVRSAGLIERPTVIKLREVPIFGWRHIYDSRVLRSNRQTCMVLPPKYALSSALNSFP